MTRPLSDHEIVAMTQQYTQDHDGNYITHLAYQEINRQVAAGRQWVKCADCGNPYPITEAWSDSTVCSDTCWINYSNYLESEQW